MKTILGTITSVCFTAIIFFSGCKKDAGPVGPQGPSGTNGTNGNANVKTVIIMNPTFTWDATYLWSSFSQGGISILKQNIVDSGSVMLYIKKTSSSSYEALPFSTSYGGGVNTNYEFLHDLNYIAVYVTNSDGSNPYPFAYSLKLVCISANGRRINPNINLRNYAEVKAAYNLQD